MSDLLSSASLLIAIVTVLYALWYPEIRKGIKEIKPTNLRSEQHISEVTGIILMRALPLMAASLGLALVFLKDAVIIVNNSLAFDSGIHGRIVNYDAVSTAFVLVEAICLLLSVQILVQSIQLALNLKALRSKEPPH